MRSALFWSFLLSALFVFPVSQILFSTREILADAINLILTPLIAAMIASRMLSIKKI